MNHNYNNKGISTRKNNIDNYNSRLLIHSKNHHRSLNDFQIKFFIASIFIITIIFIIAININAKASVNNQDSTHKYYTSVEIDNNDNLWNLESKYNNTDDDKITYINNIMKLNNLASDTIYSGESIILYYNK